MENQTNNNSVPAGESPQIANPLLKRAFMFLEDGNWESADEYCEKVLDQNPEDAYAYLGKLMAELKVGRKETLADCEQPFSDSSNYQKVLRFGSKALIQEVEEYHKSAIYNQAVQSMACAETADDYKCAIAQFESIPDFKDVQEQIAECNAGIEQLGKNFAQLREKIAPYQNALQGMICCGHDHIVGLHADGKVVAAGEDDDGRCNVKSWRDIVGIATTDYDTFALYLNGTVTKATDGDDWGLFFDEYRQEIRRWKNIVAIAGGINHIVGLCSDGTVVAAGENHDGQCNVQSWHDIVAVAAGTYHTVGLRTDGTVVSTEYIGKNYKYNQDQVQDWHDIVAIAAGFHTVGLRSDGTVVTTGENLGFDPFYRDQIQGWHDIVAIAAGNFHTIGLCADGTVVAPKMGRFDDHGQCDVQDWRDVVAVAASGEHSAALCSNGSVVVAGNRGYDEEITQNWNLFDFGGIDYCIESLKMRKTKAEKAEAERKAAVERAEAERKAAEEKARVAAEKHRQEKIAALEAERTDLQASLPVIQDELANLKGLFTGRRRKELEARITGNKSRLDAISKELTTLDAERH